jgi:hypothetical protein
VELRSPTLREIIIFVHGTGVASRDSDNPHWWQPLSHFARRLSGSLGQSCRIGNPFDGLEQILRAIGATLASGCCENCVRLMHGDGDIIWSATVMADP